MDMDYVAEKKIAKIIEHNYKFNQLDGTEELPFLISVIEYNLLPSLIVIDLA